MDKLSKENQEWLNENEKMIGHKLCYYKGDVETKLLEMESKLKQANEWISFDDNLNRPNENCNVLVSLTDENAKPRVFEVEYYRCPEYGNVFWGCPVTGDELDLDVTHWKPLPKPPTGE